jgi:hypothetical protein
MSSSFVRHSARPDEHYQAQQKRQFDRWRTATEIVQLLREAGISCELSDEGFQNRH